MKLIHDKGLCAVAENVADIKILMALGQTQTRRKYKRRKKHTFKKECTCGRTFSGKAGLHVHQSKAHGTKFAMTDANREAYLKTHTLPE